MDERALPAEELVRRGIDDLERGRPTLAAWLVSVGAPRLRAGGLDVPTALPQPEHGLYDLLSSEDPDSAHGRYNALIRRLVSYERAMMCAG